MYNQVFAQAPFGYSHAPGKWIQILYTESSHWILAAHGFEFQKRKKNHDYPVVSVYDSLKQYDDKGNVKPQTDYVYGCIASILKTPKSQMVVEEEVCHQQHNGYDCGVFSVAFATALMNNENPTDCVFHEGKMREHLKNV